MVCSPAGREGRSNSPRENAWTTSGLGMPSRAGAVAPGGAAGRSRRADNSGPAALHLANEGLWPLCHVVHTRPTFRASDWQQYQRVNRKFADAVCSEVQGIDPIVLVQDYHFALVPRMIRNRLPEATILTFWHIPWPNPEAFGICPWQRELLYGMLGADLVGFHTFDYTQYFLKAVGRTFGIETTLNSAVVEDRAVKAET